VMIGVIGLIFFALAWVHMRAMQVSA